MATITRARSSRGSDASASTARRRPSPQPSLQPLAPESDEDTATSGSPKRSRSYARAPPGAQQQDGDDEHHGSFSGWHYLPLIFALVPPLGAIVHGRAEAWTDMLMLIVISFCACVQLCGDG